MTTQESEILGLWNIADAEPDRIALVDPSGREVTYRELATLANRYATGLRDLGLRTGDVLVSMVHNCVEAIAAYFAAYQSGLYIVAVNWHLTGPEVAYILSDSEAKASCEVNVCSQARHCWWRVIASVIMIDRCTVS
ncbi:AMP-binding protein, partial [Nocardia farcinica]|uniref:AMP-binding protein n=1 Tax=Nocardia farcinica TaxID=37329 RepID=UPI0024568F38